MKLRRRTPAERENYYLGKTVELYGRLAKLRAHVRWMAQTVHQAYHTHYEPCTWEECRSDVCISTQRLFNELEEAKR